jgi:hypothetical protein
MRKFTSKIWGVPGKIKEYYSPGKFQADKRIVPLNANPLEAWDTKNSRYRRVDLIPREVPPNVQQMDGINESSNQPTSGPVVSPTPSPTLTQTPSSTPSPTPSFTPTMTQTQTPSLTPSSTPYPLPINPSLWWDSSDSSTFTLISSGGTNYVSRWNSKGTSTWSLSGSNTDQMPTLSASTLMPGNPNIVRFVPNATTSLRDALTSFGNTSITHTGGTWFYVWAKPSGSTYATSLFTSAVYSGLTNGGTVANSSGGFIDRQFFNLTNVAGMSNNYSIGNNQIISLSTPVYSATGLNDKFMVSCNFQDTTGEFNYLEINQSAQTNTTSFTGSSAVGTVNSFIMGVTITSSAATQSFNNSNVELAEVMWFNVDLTPAQREQVELYLKDKWRYDEWASPVPTATPTASPTQTSTTTVTPTPSPTPPFNPLTLNPMIWIDFNDASTLSLRSGQFVQSVSNKGNWTAFTGFSQTTAADQPSWSASTMGTGKSAITISNNYLQASTNLTGDTWNTVMVLKFSGSNGFQPVKITGSGGRAWSNFFADAANTRYYDFIVQPGGLEYRQVFTGYSAYSTPHIAQSYLSNSSTTVVDYFTINNSGQTETNIQNNLGAAGNPGNYTSPVFRIVNEDGIYSDIPGEIGEIYFFDKELTSTQQSGLINYLKTKWGIA